MKKDIDFRDLENNFENKTSNLDIKNRRLSVEQVIILRNEA